MSKLCLQFPQVPRRCPNCGSWSSFVEEVEVAEVKNARVSLTGEKTKPMKLADVTSINVHRTKTEMEEFNRVLGGGVVPGSLVLIGGDPGIGKSTCSFRYRQLSQVGTVLYVSGENQPSRLNCEQSAWEISTVSFIFMPRPICKACEQKWSASSLTSSSLTLFRPLCLLRSQGCRGLFLRCVR